MTFPDWLEVAVLLLEAEKLALLLPVSVTRMEAVELRESAKFCDGVVVELCETERVVEIVAETEVVDD